MENLEKKIKDKLQNNEISVDTNELWSEVYPHIKPKKNRRAFVFLLFGFLWLTSLIGVAYYFSLPNDESVIMVEEGTDVELVGELAENITVAMTESKIIKENKTISAIDEETSTSEVDASQRELEKTKKSSQSNIENTVQEIISKSSTKNLKQKELLKNTVNGARFQTKKIKKEKPTLPTFRTTEKQGEIQKQEFYTDNTPNLDKSASNSVKMLGSEITRANLSYNLLNTTASTLPYSYPQPLLPNGFFAEDASYNEFSKFSIYALGGFAGINKKLTARDLSNADLESRLAAESNLESISGELGLSYQINPNLLISGGVNYIRINEQIQDSYSVTDVVLLENVIIENIITSRGSEPVYGNIQAERTINTNLTAYNRYSDFALSLELTYLLKSEGLTPYISAGIQQSISSSQTGFWILNDNDLYDISDDPEGHLSDRYGLGLRFGAGVNLDLSSRAALRLGTRFTKYLDPITTETYSLKQKYDLLGLSAGLIIKL